ncbi:MAG: hypothetical protein E5X23_23755 [Mesorhizobium sp.]|uniref:hypothetical protein n=1 Tax=unclassified Mesorhizobium TaxID=325217 RepID=UPI000F75B99A|nr:MULTISPECIES: hypothetical protein [unclassified Mesorhizobium]TGV91933.1 hypothetical protein EN801_013485 [Mesorhizobium sp. M00.F.Ca.ET.158.01.1.1]AZO58640.1 hypothetical protein EJ078_04390 [Mesorhizobium sp. M1A.F.Ca.IN.022.06.1.1]MCT2579239.1 hypothetical protein [Mesorhizobium sp. P13.3]MDF3168588.1 hypothetical protein [Mesorhizobium sp. P16.1]MDF3178438.1 hypothetical protein [Mesorhizobium sp. P17.1]
MILVDELGLDLSVLAAAALAAEADGFERLVPADHLGHVVRLEAAGVVAVAAFDYEQHVGLDRPADEAAETDAGCEVSCGGG